MRALVIDDSPAVRHGIQQVALQLGIECLEADDADTGFRKVERTPKLKLVLVDWQLAAAENMQWLRSVRERPQFNGVRIVVMMIKSELPEAPLAQAAGADEVVLKPFNEAWLQQVFAPLRGKSSDVGIPA